MSIFVDFKKPSNAKVCTTKGKYIWRGSAIRANLSPAFGSSRDFAAMIDMRHRSANIMVSEKALQEFKKLWKEEFGEDISDDKALESATALLTMFDAIYRPIRKEWDDEYDNNNKTNGTN